MKLQDLLVDNSFIDFPEVFNKLKGRKLTISKLVDLCIAEDELHKPQNGIVREDGSILPFEECGFEKEIVDALKNDRFYMDGYVPFFVRLLRDQEAFKVLLESKLLTLYDLKHIWNKAVEKSEVAQFTCNPFLLSVLILSYIVSFEEFVENLKKTDQLPYILTNDDFFKTLNVYRLLDLKNLTTLWNAADPDNIIALQPNEWLTYKLIVNHITDFRTLVDRYKNEKDGLRRFIKSKKLIKTLIKTQTITDNDILYLLKQLETEREVLGFCEYNQPLVKYALKNFLLDKGLLMQYHKAIKNASQDKDSDVFWHFDFHANAEYVVYDEIRNQPVYNYKDEDKIDTELVELIRLNRAVQCLDFPHEEQKDLFYFLLENKKFIDSFVRGIIDRVITSFESISDIKNHLITKNAIESKKTSSQL